MKSLQKILPAKTLTLIQNIVCLLIMIAIVLLSFGTVFTATIEKSDETEELFNDVITSLDFGEESEKKVEMPDTVDVSAPFIVKSVSSIGDIVKGVMDMAEDVGKLANDAQDVQDNVDNMNNSIDNADIEGVQNNSASLESSASELQDQADKTKEDAAKIGEAMKSDNFIGLVSLIIVIAQGFSQSFMLGLVYMALLGTAITLPFIIVIRTIIAIVQFFIHLADPGVAYTKICKQFRGIFVLFPILWLYKIVAPQVTFGMGVTTMIVLCIVAMVINFVASRIKCYTPAQFRYLNVLQIVSAASIVGYFLFMMNIGKTNMFAHIWDGLPNFIESKPEGGAVAITILCVLAIIVFLFPTCKLIKNQATKLCCMVPAGKKKAHDVNIVSAAVSLVLIVAPVILMTGKFALDLGDEMPAFIMCVFGILIMVASEIVLMVLKKTVCFTTSKEDVIAVLSGCPTGGVDKTSAKDDDASEPECDEAELAEKTDKVEAAEESIVVETVNETAVEESAEETVESEEATEEVESEAEESEEAEEADAEADADAEEVENKEEV